MWSECTHASETYQDRGKLCVCLFVKNFIKETEGIRMTIYQLSDSIRHVRKHYTIKVVQALLCSRLTFNDYLSTPRLSRTLQAHPTESLILLTPRALVPIPSHLIPSIAEALYSCPPIDFPRHALVVLVCLTPALFPKAFKCFAFPHHCVSNDFLWLWLFTCPPWCHTEKRGGKGDGAKKIDFDHNMNERMNE